jgi:restriction endonuclease S subunit
MGRSQLTNRASNAADGKFNINIQTLRSLLLPHPSLDEQIRIVKILKSVDVKIYALEHELALTHELFHRLLEDLLGAHLKICAPAS